jgi:RimJ/RimL family protein N-acetyltransferase
MSMFQFGEILFRPRERRDLELIHEWENDSELMMYSRSRPLNIVNMAQLEKQFEERLKDEKSLFMMVELTSAKEPIGIASLEQRDWGNVKTGHLGTYIAEKKLWGKGIGRQITVGLLEMAFMQLDANRCDAGTVEYNDRAQKTLKWCGFKQSGAARKVHFVNGRTWDHFYFDLLRKEYLERRMELLRQTLGDGLTRYLETRRISGV